MDNNPFMWEGNSPQPIDSSQNHSVTPQQQAPQGANPFMWDNTAQQAPPPEQTSSFMAGVEAFNRQFGRMAEGVMDLATWGKTNDAVRNVHHNLESSYANTSAKHPIATTVGGVLGGVGAGVAYGSLGSGLASTALGTGIVGETLAPAVEEFASAHPLLTSLGKGAAGGSGLSYLDYADTQGQRLTKGLLGGVLGGTLSGLGYEVGKIGGKMVSPEKYATEDLASTIKADLGSDAADKLPGMLQPAIDMGTTRSPGQVVGGLTRSRELAQGADLPTQVRARGIDRVQTEQTLQGVNDIIDKIAPQGTQELKDQLYKGLAPVQLPDDVVASLKANPAIQEHLDVLNKTDNSTVTQATRSLPDNSVLKLDIVKQEIDDKLFNDARALDPTNKMGNEARRALTEASNNIKDTIDQVVPQYAPARQEAQKLVLQNRYENLLLKKGAKVGNSNGLGIDETWQTLFPTKESQQVFVNDVTTAGGDPKQAENIITLLDQLRQSPLKRIYSRPSGEDNSTIFYGNKVGFIQKIYDKLTAGNYNRALINLSFNGNEWADKVTSILKEQAANRPESFLSLLADASNPVSGATRAAIVQSGRLMTPPGTYQQGQQQ